MIELPGRFASLLNRLGAHPSSTAVFERLHAAWASPARHYHDVKHLTECLQAVDLEAASTQSDLVELALWYHDSIYEAGAPDCEARSAEWLRSDAGALGIPSDLAQQAAALVEATAHGKASVESQAAALVVDIDLSILGSEPARFMEFELGVEKEYAAIPTAAFRRGRGIFLSQLLEAPIYRTAAYRERLEQAARANISALLASDRYRAHLSPLTGCRLPVAG